MNALIEKEKLKNILGELIMYQNKEIERLHTVKKKTTFRITAQEVSDDLTKLEQRQSDYKKLFKSIKIY